MFGLTIQGDLQTIQLQAGLVCNSANQTSTFFMLDSPSSADRYSLPHRKSEYRPYPPVVEMTNCLRH